MIQLNEVGPRDGLQMEKKILTPAERVQLIEQLIECGIRKIEVASFVNPKVVPQMAGAEEVIALLPEREDVLYSGLILSRSGFERAIQTKLQTYNLVLAVSETFNLKNAKRTVEQSKDELISIIHDAKASGKTVHVVLGTVFGCPYEGEVSSEKVLQLVDEFLGLGIGEITLADTTGLANPTQVEQLVLDIFQRYGKETPLGLHFHNTRGLGLANALAGLKSGVIRFDSSIAGIGGCPFAPKAVGNICTDDFLYMLHGMGFETGIDLEKVIETSIALEKQLGRTLQGMVMKTV